MPHFLKKLELNGFKSFAGKTILEFPAGIVAVVGPNGSGKSNIVDSLRWLLGERDAKNLRGAKVEDLIFAGTQKRPRVGMAQASLYFENSNKFFPVDFEEVVVSREIRRDGQSRYFLNRSEILLRDLVDFFAKARLGSRGLIIIGQGDSDLFIRSTSYERREMIEEILGLREYQLKKADAERRLKNSRINLDKVQALIEEIVPHLRSLKRQTGRWEKRSAFEEELKMLESRFFGSRLRVLGEKRQTVEAKIAEHKKRFDVLAGEKKAAEVRQAEIEAAQPEEKKDLAKIKAEIQALFEKRSVLQKDLGRLEAQIELSQSSAGRASSQSVDHLLDLVRKIKSELEAALDEEPLGVHAAIENIIEEIAMSLEEKPEKKTSVPEGLRESLKKITDDVRLIESELAALREKEKSFERSQEGFYRLFKAAMNDVQSVNQKVEAWERDNRENLLEQERITLRRDEIVHQITQAGRRVEDFSKSSSVEMSESESNEMERKIFRLRGDLASIGEVDESLMKEASDTEARYEFLMKESQDLAKAVQDLTALMNELSEKIKNEFEKSLHKINAEFEKFFSLMFGGGSARLKVEKPVTRREASEDGEVEESEAKPETEEVGVPQKDGGVEIEVKLPRKKVTSLDMLSGGERSLVGIAALFAMVSVSPPPFLVLDEIDAPLDERNARRFGEMLKEFSKRTQFIVVTHNRATMEAAEILYGVTLDEDGTSKIVSLKLEPVE
jgi:chromosome segregation protein